MSIKLLRYKKTIQIILLIISLLLVLYSLKSPIFRLILAQKVERTEVYYGLKILYSDARLKGFTKVEIKDLSVKNSVDTFLFSASRVNVDFPLKSILKLQIKPNAITIDSLRINLNPALGRFDKVNVSSDSTLIINDSNPIHNFKVQYLNRALKELLQLANTKIVINEFICSYKSSSYSLSISTKEFTSINGDFNSSFSITENDSTNYISFLGRTDKSKKNISISIFGNNQRVNIPLAKKVLSLSSSFDSLKFVVSGNNFSRDSIHITISSSVYNLKAHHTQLSDKDVDINYAQLTLGLGITQNSLHFDSTSFFTLNTFSLPFTFSLNTSESTQIKFDINDDNLDMNSLFESLPKGLFSTLKGLKVMGNAKFALNTHIDFANPDSLTFYVNLKPNNFKVISFGDIDFSLLRDTFTYSVFVNDTLTKHIKVGSSYANYRSLEKISPYVKNAVIVSEDGGFFHHKGFDLDGFNFALARNIKDKRLGRGGSTLTMQLVKNLYLNRNKTLTRKAEEALIVWLIETQRLVEKERILEIYLNIIDWGPEIHGITQASDFYFGKDPLDINLNEAIFLASIIPQPNKYMYYFDKNANLREHMIGFYSFVGKTLLDRDLITDEELENLTPNITLTTKALSFLKTEQIESESEISIIDQEETPE